MSQNQTSKSTFNSSVLEEGIYLYCVFTISLLIFQGFNKWERNGTVIYPRTSIINKDIKVHKVHKLTIVEPENIGVCLLLLEMKISGFVFYGILLLLLLGHNYQSALEIFLNCSLHLLIMIFMYLLTLVKIFILVYLSLCNMEKFQCDCNDINIPGFKQNESLLVLVPWE